MKTCFMVVLLICGTGYAAGKDSGFIDNLHASIQEAKKAQDILSGITDVELAEEIFAHFDSDFKLTNGVDKKLQVLAQEIGNTHVATFLLDNSLTKEEAVELAVLFDKVPLYAKISDSDVTRKGLDSHMVMFDEMHHHGAHETIDVGHQYFLNDKQLDYLIDQPQKFRVHWYRAREIFKLALRRIG